MVECSQRLLEWLAGLRPLGPPHLILMLYGLEIGLLAGSRLSQTCDALSVALGFFEKPLDMWSWC
jgi:hypothetical protein